MRKVALSVILSSIVAVAGLNAQDYIRYTLVTKIDSLSYSLGLLIGNNLQAQGIEKLNTEIYSQGLQDGFRNDPDKMTYEEANLYIQSYFESLMARQAKDNLNEGIAFLQENKEKEGVVTLNSGLQYKVLKAGDGPSPKSGDKVKVHYRGTLLNGEEFDSSYERGEPVVFGINQVIKGWTEALMLMSTGSHWMLYIPSPLAYGEKGAGDVIGPNSTLIFEVELLEVIPQE